MSAYRLPDATLERALAATLPRLRNEYTFRLANEALMITRGWRVAGMLWSLAGVVLADVVILAIASFVFPTATHGTPRWALIAAGVIAVLAIPGAYLVGRPAGVAVDRRARRVVGRGGEFGFEVTLAPGSELVLDRTAGERRTGHGEVVLAHEATRFPLLDVGDVGELELARLKLFALALAAWLGIPCRDTTAPRHAEALHGADAAIGLVAPAPGDPAKPAPGSSARDVGDLVVGALELLQNV